MNLINMLLFSKTKLISLVIRILLMILPLMPSLTNSEEYLIGAGDIIKINVFDYPDLSIVSRVSGEGKITFPLVGEVPVGGKNTAEAEKIIAYELSSKGVIRQPHVTIVISEFVSKKASILGYVEKPGSYSLDKPTTLLEMIALAGGLTPEGDDKALLTHNENNVTSSQELDLYTLFHGDLQQNIKIKAGDIIYIPKSQVFYIYGEVQHPGMYRLQRKMNVAQAISAGGGITPEGTDNNISVKRSHLQNKVSSHKVELGDLVQPDDVIYVQESWF